MSCSGVRAGMSTIRRCIGSTVRRGLIFDANALAGVCQLRTVSSGLVSLLLISAGAWILLPTTCLTAEGFVP